MEWIQVFTIIGVLGGFMFWQTSKLDRDISKHIDRIDADMKIQGARTDKLYEMFIDLLKDRSK